MTDANAGDPTPGGETDATHAAASRRARLLIAVGVVAAGAVIALLVALTDEGGEPHPAAAGPEGATSAARAPGAPASEPAAKVVAAPAAAVKAVAPPPVAASDEPPAPAAGAPVAAGAGGGSGAGGRGAGGHGGERSARLQPASATVPSSRPAAASSSAHHPDGGAPVASGPDGGTRPPERKASASDTGRRPTNKDDGEDREDELVLVARFVPTGGAALEGKVVDADTGRPVSGVAVEARHAGKYMKGSTDGSGVFRMAGLPPETRVVVWIGDKRDPYIAERIDVAIPGEGQKADTGLVRLLRGDEMGPRLDGWVGLFVTRRSGRVTVSAVTPWLPADRADVRVGDVVVSVNGRDIAGFGPRAATYLLRGPPATSVSFIVEDHTAARRKLTLDRVPR